MKALPRYCMIRLPRRSMTTLCLSVVAFGVTGCRSMGPATISRDRFNYSGALAESWKSQMLLNIVKTRYLDLPIYLDVGQIVSGYTFETSATIGGSFPQNKALGGNTATLGGAARYSDSPTITYTPLTGEKFLEGFLVPLEPSKVFSLLQAGYAADFILGLTVDSINGLRNRSASFRAKRQADPEFFRVASLLREIQDAAALGLRVERPTNAQPATVFFFRNDKADQEDLSKIAEVRKLLGLPPGQSVFKIVSSPIPGREGELAIATRSLWHIMAALSHGVEVPPKHLERKLTPPIAGMTEGEQELLRVHSGPKAPADTFAAVPYEGQWFWIADNEWESKRTFTAILFLFTLANTGAAQNLPTLTIPTR